MPEAVVRVEAIVADFLEKAFGSAREPMRDFYALITQDTQRRSPADLVGRMYRHLWREGHSDGSGRTG